MHFVFKLLDKLKDLKIWEKFLIFREGALGAEQLVLAGKHIWRCSQEQKLGRLARDRRHTGAAPVKMPGLSFFGLCSFTRWRVFCF